jgi:hypothetical protein
MAPFSRLLTFALVAAALLVGATPALASAPFNTTPPTLDLSGGTLTGHNGGFMSYSGTPDRYEFRFVRESDGAARQEGSSNVYPLVSGDCGSFHVEVRAGIYSKYVRQDGTIAYDTVEWSSWATSNSVNVGGTCAAAPAKVAAPAAVAAPAVTGQAAEGQQLSGSNGSWAGTAPIGFGYQWQRCSAAGTACAAIAGATAATYTVAAADVGSRLRLAVTASNGSGSVSSASQPTEIVRGLPPVNAALPAIAGLPWQGQPLTVTNGTWTGRTPTGYTFQWQRCSAHMNGCTAIEGATSAAYAPAAADLGSRLRVVVTATAAGSAASVTSAATIAIQSAQPAGSNLALAADRIVTGDKLRLRATVGRAVAGRDVTVRIQVRELRGFLVAGASVSVSGGTAVVSSTTDAGGEALLRVHVARGRRSLRLVVHAETQTESATTTLRAAIAR